MNEKSKLLLGSCGSGRKTTFSELIETLPEDTKRIYVYPEDEVKLFNKSGERKLSVVSLLSLL